MPTDGAGPIVPRLDTTPPIARTMAIGDASQEAAAQLDRVVADLESNAVATTWALRLVLLGVVGFVVLLLAVL